MDATVYYGSSDFRFKNNTDYPVKIVTESYDQGGSRYLTVKIYGTNLDGSYAVPKSDVFDRVNPTTVYKADESTPPRDDQVDSVQNAYTGWSSQTYRYIYDKDGKQIGTGSFMKYRIDNSLKTDLKVASEDSAAKIFMDLYKKDRDFYNLLRIKTVCKVIS